jgi:hypothetical protein
MSFIAAHLLQLFFSFFLETLPLLFDLSNLGSSLFHHSERIVRYYALGISFFAIRVLVSPYVF